MRGVGELTRSAEQEMAVALRIDQDRVVLVERKRRALSVDAWPTQAQRVDLNPLNRRAG